MAAYTLKFTLSENAAIHFKGDGVSQGHRGGKNECVKVAICNQNMRICYLGSYSNTIVDI